jgi:hypothetical protein
MALSRSAQRLYRSSVQPGHHAQRVIRVDVVAPPVHGRQGFRA